MLSLQPRSHYSVTMAENKYCHPEKAFPTSNVHVVDVDGARLSLNCGSQQAYCSSPRLHTSMEHRYNDTDRGKPNNSEKTCPVCHSVHHKSYVD
jgi:hypothetical protein